MELDPTIAEIPDMHAVARFIFEARAVPPSLINSKEETAQAIAAQAEQAQVEQAAEVIPGMARAAKDLQSANLLPAEVGAAVA